MRRFRRYGCSALLALLGCSTAPENADVAGAWILRSVDGNALPVRIADIENGARFLRADTLTMESSGTYRRLMQTADSVTIRSGGGATTYTLLGAAFDVGEWTRSGNSISFAAPPEQLVRGEVNGATFYVNRGGRIYRYSPRS